MRWGKKKNPTINPQRDNKIPYNDDGGDDDGEIKRPASSSFSLLTAVLPLSSWLSKLRPPKHNRFNNASKLSTAPTPAPTPRPSFSPPPLAPTRTRSHLSDAAPRRLSLDGADSRIARSRSLSLHRPILSLGSDLDFLLLDPARSPSSRPRRRHRRRHRPASAHHHDLKPIKTGPGPDPDPRRGGRRSFSGGRIRPRVRVCSPRLSNPSPTAKEKERRLESFAVVKRSRDPVRDFRESMVEMIWERGIGRPEELERLLACYLSLNSDEHHDVIVKVFRQVWFDLNRDLDRLRDVVL